ncbi:MAG: sigma-70 family RNA polymerase sigma factor [Bacteroidales bacterium]|nr:sigma-70 family RNA polymerase sigma factor [Bacteroidales bacterium]
MTEGELVRLVQQRDKSAMKMLYHRYVGYLAAVCARYVPDDDEVKDILQEAFIKIFQGADRFEYRGEGSLKAWMTRIVVNDALKSLRRKKATALTDRFPDSAEEEEPAFDTVPLPVIHEMIRKLPDGYRTVFNLFVFEDRSHKEIAALLGIKENSSASQLFHAKALLARWIKEYQRCHDHG